MPYQSQHEEYGEPVVRLVTEESPNFLFSESLRVDAQRALRPEADQMLVMSTIVDLSRVALFHARKKTPQAEASSLHFLPLIHTAHPGTLNMLYDDLVGTGLQLEESHPELSAQLLAGAGLKPISYDH